MWAFRRRHPPRRRAAPPHPRRRYSPQDSKPWPVPDPAARQGDPAMQSFATPSTAGDACPFQFNFDAATFKVGDVVSYRVSERFGDMPFVGTLLAVEADHVM